VPGTEQRESERRFYTATPGHNEFLINHETVKMEKTIQAPGGLNALQTNLSHNLSGEVFTTDGPNGTLDLWHLKRTGNVDVPYWDVKVDPTIIKNHGDIWNPKAQAMMAAIFRMTNPLMNRASKVKPRAVLKKEPTRAALVPESNQSRSRLPRKMKTEPAAKLSTPKPSTNRELEPALERTR
jgi:hypothetical protein